MDTKILDGIYHLERYDRMYVESKPKIYVEVKMKL
jgi:hypothetical protein